MVSTKLVAEFFLTITYDLSCKDIIIISWDKILPLRYFAADNGWQQSLSYQIPLNYILLDIQRKLYNNLLPLFHVWDVAIRDAIVLLLTPRLSVRTFVLSIKSRQECNASSILETKNFHNCAHDVITHVWYLPFIRDLFCCSVPFLRFYDSVTRDWQWCTVYLLNPSS